MSALEGIDALDVSREPDRESGRAAVEQGDRDLVLVIPAGFGPSDEPLALEVLFNEARAREAEVRVHRAAAGVRRPCRSA